MLFQKQALLNFKRLFLLRVDLTGIIVDYNCYMNEKYF